MSRRAAIAILATLAAGLAKGDELAAERGQLAFQFCFSCHSVQPGEMNLEGPNLRGVVGRRIAAQEGFEYSPALRALALREGNWTADLLDRFIAAPSRVAPKTNMSFRGIDDESERADLAAYLRAMAD